MQVSETFAKVVGVSLAVVLIVSAILFVNLAINPTAHVRAQNAGTVGIQATMTPVFSSQASTKSSNIFPDIGQGENVLFFCNTTFTGTIDFDWSPTGVAPFFLITQASYVGDSSCHTLQTGGYFPNLRSTLTVTAGSLSAWYSASSGPISFAASGVGSNGPTSPVVCDRNYTTSVATGANIFIGTPVNTGDAIVICGMTVSFNGTTAAGNIAVQWSVDTTCGALSSASLNILTTASTPQTLILPFIQRTLAVGKNEACFVNASGATAQISVSMASVRLP